MARAASGDLFLATGNLVTRWNGRAFRTHELPAISNGARSLTELIFQETIRMN